MIDPGTIEVTVGDDRYHLPATVKGRPSRNDERAGNKRTGNERTGDEPAPDPDGRRDPKAAEDAVFAHRRVGARADGARGPRGRRSSPGIASVRSRRWCCAARATMAATATSSRGGWPSAACACASRRRAMPRSDVPRRPAREAWGGAVEALARRRAGAAADRRACSAPGWRARSTTPSLGPRAGG